MILIAGEDSACRSTEKSNWSTDERPTPKGCLDYGWKEYRHSTRKKTQSKAIGTWNSVLCSHLLSSVSPPEISDHQVSAPSFKDKLGITLQSIQYSLWYFRGIKAWKFTWGESNPTNITPETAMALVNDHKNPHKFNFPSKIYFLFESLIKSI